MSGGELKLVEADEPDDHDYRDALQVADEHGP
jgi:hypothetical protein